MVVAEHMGVCSGALDAGVLGEVVQAAGSGVPVHPGAAGVQQDRSTVPEPDGPIDGASDRWRQRDQDDLGAFTADPQHPMSVLLAKVGDVRASGFEDPQAE